MMGLKNGICGVFSRSIQIFLPAPVRLAAAVAPRRTWVALTASGTSGGGISLGFQASPERGRLTPRSDGHFRDKAHAVRSVRRTGRSSTASYLFKVEIQSL